MSQWTPLVGEPGHARLVPRRNAWLACRLSKSHAAVSATYARARGRGHGRSALIPGPASRSHPTATGPLARKEASGVPRPRPTRCAKSCADHATSKPSGTIDPWNSPTTTYARAAASQPRKARSPGTATPSTSFGTSRANLSNHLTCLRDCGLVTATAEGRRVRYDLADPQLGDALRLLASLDLPGSCDR